MSQGTYISMGGTGNSQIGAVNFRGITSTSNVVVYGQIVNQVTNYSNDNISGRLDIISPSSSRGNITYMSCVNGNVGLNNSNPQYGVDISGTFNVKNNGVNALVVVNGNVGLNNSNPQYGVDISGSLNVKNNGVNTLVVVNSNVGINNTNPLYGLDVSGTINVNSPIQFNYTNIPTFTSNQIGYSSGIVSIPAMLNIDPKNAPYYKNIATITLPSIGVYILTIGIGYSVSSTTSYGTIATYIANTNLYQTNIIGKTHSTSCFVCSTISYFSASINQIYYAYTTTPDVVSSTTIYIICGLSGTSNNTISINNGSYYQYTRIA